MNWIKKLFSNGQENNNTFTRKGELSRGELVEAQVCPNCWGRQEYGSQFKRQYEDFTKSNINHDKTQRKAFIQQFVETHVTGIHLKSEDEKISCTKCRRTYSAII